MPKKDFGKIEKKSICINEIFYENGFVYPVYVSYQELKNGMDLLLISDENKSHYVYIKNLTDLCAIKQSVKIKNTFVDIVYNVLVAKRF